MFLTFVNCGDKLIKNLTGFESNKAPQIEEISVCHVTAGACSTVTQEALLPSNQFLISVKAQDVDSKELSYEYLSDIGTFANVTITDQGSSAVLTLPNVFPAGLDISVSVQITDSKRAKTIQSIDLGSGRLGLDLSSQIPAPYTSQFIFENANDFLITFKANSADGFFQTGFFELNEPCVADRKLGYKPFSKGITQNVYICGSNVTLPGPNNCKYKFPAANSEKKLCLFVRDNLLQTEVISYVLNSDDTDPKVTFLPSVNTGLFAIPQNVNISCTDNYECDKICYNIGYDTGGTPTVVNPNCSTIGTAFTGNSLDLTIGNQGNGYYQIKYYVIDKAGRKSSTLPIVSSFRVDDTLPIITMGTPQYSNVSISGNTTSDFTWQSNQNGSYHLQLDESVACPISGIALANAYTQNAPIVSTITASSLFDQASDGLKTVKICFRTDTNVFGYGILTVTLDNTVPSYVDVLPVDGGVDVSAYSVVKVNLSESVDPTTVTANITDTSCTGSLQISKDNFISCVQMKTAPVANGDNSSFTLEPMNPNFLTPIGTYKTRMTSSIKDFANNNMTAYTTAGFTTINDVFFVIESVSTTTVTGSYDASASSIAIEVAFSRNVSVVGGSPYLTLDSGGMATYVGNNNGKVQLIYNITTGDNTSDLNYLSVNSFSTNGASLYDSTLVQPSIELPALTSIKSLAGNQDILIDTQAPTSGTISSIDAGQVNLNQMTLNWNIASDNLTTAGNIKYNIYQANSSGAQNFAVPSYVVIGGTSKLLTSSDITLDTFYYFVVRAVDETGNENTNTTEISAEAETDRTASTFAGITGINFGQSSPQIGKMVLNWSVASDNVTAPGNIVYKIYQSTASGGQNFTTATYSVTGGLSKTLTASDIAMNTTYYYVIRAVDEAGNEDSNTLEISGQAQTDLTAPTFGSATIALVRSQNSVKLTWGLATDNYTVAPAIYYRICVQNVAGLCTATFPFLYTTAAGATSFIVNGLLSNSTYFFLVKAIDSATNISSNNTEVTIKTLPPSSFLIFRTGKTYTPNLGGVTGADAKCNDATDINHPGAGVFRAMIMTKSNPTSCPASIPDITRNLTTNWVFYATRDYYRTDGIKLATSLSNKKLPDPIDNDLMIGSGTINVYTGMINTWSPHDSNSCNWTDNATMALYGKVSFLTFRFIFWTSSLSSFSLVCVQQ